MSLPMLSLAKRKRVKPIEWSNQDGSLWCRVTGSDFGIATVWDFDVILWAISQLNEAVEHHLSPAPRIEFQPYDMLKAVGRGVGGQNYKELEAALERLVGTVVETSIRADRRRTRAMFHWLDSWTHKVNETTGRSLGMTITVPDWIYRGVVDDRAVLAIPPEYFKITSGLGRWLYRLARRHAGKQIGGWRFLVRGLHERSGSTQSYGDFARDLRRIVARDNLPEYHLEITTGQKGDPMVIMVRDPARHQVPQRRDLRRFQLPPRLVD